jgi:hypothetical protein
MLLADGGLDQPASRHSDIAKLRTVRITGSANDSRRANSGKTFPAERKHRIMRKTGLMAQSRSAPLGVTPGSELQPLASTLGRYSWAIEILQSAAIVGWVIDHLDPEPVQLEFENLATKRLALASADLARPDLIAAFSRDVGGFRIELPWDVRLRSSTFALSVLGPDRRVHLCRFNLPPLVGAFEQVTHKRLVEGWTLNAADPDLRPLVEVMHGGEVVASGRATMFRPDLKKVTGEDGFCGFRIIAPMPVEKRETAVRALLPDGESLLLRD